MPRRLTHECWGWRCPAVPPSRCRIGLDAPFATHGLGRRRGVRCRRSRRRARSGRTGPSGRRGALRGHRASGSEPVRRTGCCGSPLAFERPLPHRVIAAACAGAARYAQAGPAAGVLAGGSRRWFPLIWKNARGCVLVLATSAVPPLRWSGVGWPLHWTGPAAYQLPRRRPTPSTATRDKRGYRA